MIIESISNLFIYILFANLYDFDGYIKSIFASITCIIIAINYLYIEGVLIFSSNLISLIILRLD